MTRGSKNYYYHFNGHGDTIALTNNAGNVVQTYKYDIWGNPLECTGNIENPFTYGGQWGYVYDSESSLYFLKTRYYDSSIGRFTTKDRFAGFENDPDSQNRYVYCQNDPVGNVDPNGESVGSLILGIALQIITIASLASPWGLTLKLISCVGIGVAFFLLTEYNYTKSKKKLDTQLKNRSITSNFYNKQLRILDINRKIGWFSAGITVICSLIGLRYPTKALIANTATYIGMSIGWQLTQFGIANDISEMLSGNFSWY